jgi:triphosphoribosyl-dephospho-CoA synthase
MSDLPQPENSLRDRIGAAYQRACLGELDALKPGNVHRFADGHGMRVEDFVTSAEISVEPLTDPALGLGERIYRAVEATHDAVGCNTNLGILLLCAPLVQAMFDGAPSVASLRKRLHPVLSQSDITDTQWLYRAIRLAAPAGLGHADTHDVFQAPSAPLLEVMSHASERDLIARQYVTGYTDLYDYALPRFAQYEQRWRNREWATTGLFLSLLARYPDTHVERKYGLYKAVVTTLRATELSKGLSQAAKPEDYLHRLLQADEEFKREGINPGTSADMTVTTLFISHLESILPAFDKNTGYSRVRDSRPDEVGIRS